MLTFQHRSCMAMKHKRRPALTVSFWFLIWHEAEKGSDRFYARPDPLSPLKRKVFYQFLYLLRNKLLCPVVSTFNITNTDVSITTI